MNMGDIELKLLANKPIYIENAGEITFQNVGDVIDLGESYYNQILSSILFKKVNLENQEGIEDLSDFELFCMFCHHNEKFRNVVFNGLRLLFKVEPNLDNENIGIKLGENNRIDKDNFAIMQDIVSKAHWIKIDEKKEPEFKPFDERAQAIIDMVMKGRKERESIKPKNTVNLHSILSGLSWRPNGTTQKEIFDLTIYQVYVGYFVSQNIDSHYFTLTGIYTGNIDATKIDMSDLNWAKRLEV